MDGVENGNYGFVVLVGELHPGAFVREVFGNAPCGISVCCHESRCRYTRTETYGRRTGVVREEVKVGGQVRHIEESLKNAGRWGGFCRELYTPCHDVWVVGGEGECDLEGVRSAEASVNRITILAEWDYQDI